MTGRAPLAAAGGNRTVHVEHCMGTVFSIDIRDPGRWDGAIRDVLAWLHSVDATFSTYCDDSDISRLRRGELTVADADPHIGDVLELCGRLQAETGGYFTARWRGGFDPTGVVKGWAVERASALLRGLGSPTTPSTAAVTCNSPAKPHPTGRGGSVSATPMTGAGC